MGRRRAVILVSLAVLALGTTAWLLFGPASGSDRNPSTAATSTAAPTTSAASRPPATTTTSARPSTPSSSRPSGGSPRGPVAEAEGWRLAVRTPESGATVGRRLIACYEITGTSREPVLVLEAALVRAGGAVAGRTRSDAVAGRGSATLTFAGVPEGHYDLRLRLKVDGRWIAGLAVAVDDVRLVDGAPRGSCG